MPKLCSITNASFHILYIGGIMGTKWGICFLFKGGALAEGFQERLMEFQSFERTFEVRMYSNGVIK